MFKNHLNIALRNIFKNKLNSFLNLSGLALGIACSLLLIFHIKDELSFDRGFTKSDRIYRITIDSQYGDSHRHWACIPPVFGLEFKEKIPEVEDVTRFFYTYSVVLSYIPDNGGPISFEEQGGFFADSTAADMFDLKFIKGDPSNSLKEVNTIILTESMAKKYFGDEDPVGKNMSLNNPSFILQVTGVIKDFPFKTHFNFDFLISMSTYYSVAGWDINTTKTWKSFYTYVLLNSKQAKEIVESKITDFKLDFYKEFGTRNEILSNNLVSLQPLTDIHLFSSLEKEMGPNSDISYIYIFSAIALLILIIAGVNFVNISTSQAFQRMKEVGVRKIMGAQKKQLVKQFLRESFILTIASVLIAIIIFKLSIPFYNNLSGKNLEFSQILSFDNIIILIVIIISLGFLAGLYPALFMSNFKTIDSIKGVKRPGTFVTKIRQGLVVFQFMISVFMIFSTIIIFRQMKFFENKDLGFDKDKIVALKLYGGLYQGIMQNTDALKSDLTNYSSISGISRLSTLPGERFSMEFLTPDGISQEDLPVVRFMRVDEDLIKTLGIQLEEGRDFSTTDIPRKTFIVNETAVNILNIENPIGQMANHEGDTGMIVGVIKDFHFASLHTNIEPLVLMYAPESVSYMIIKILGNNIPETLELIKTRIDEIAPGHLFNYTFVDDELNKLYVSEGRVSDLFKAFSVFAIIISCLGLFGLATYYAEHKTKEIGIRKVLGASGQKVFLMMLKMFSLWILIANIIAWPLAVFFINKWLQNFAYKVTIGYWVFIASGFIVLFVALLTVSYQTIKAANKNPVDSLRYE